MSEPKTPLTLTGHQLYELKFFCRNVIGCRQEFYKIMDEVNAYDAKLKRMEKTCALIEKHLGEKLESLYERPIFDETLPGAASTKGSP